MEVDGAPYAPRSPRDARDRGIALIHQELSLFPHLSVAENVLMGAEPSRRGLWDRSRGAAHHARGAGRVRPPRDRPRRHGRAACRSARARSSRSAGRSPARARVVLMDEPTSSLPARRRGAALRARSAGCRRRGVAVVYISHFLEETRAVAAAFTVLRDGRTVGERLARVRDQRRAHRPDGGPHRGRAVSPARGTARAGERGARGARASPPPGSARPRSACGAARSSASSASWARAARRWCGRSSASPARGRAA